MAELTPRYSGEETSETLAAVLEDQAERKRLQEAGTAPQTRSHVSNIAVIPLALLTLWFVISPPPILRPRAAPPPTLAEVQNGLQMDIYLVAAQVLGYREANGQLPAKLEDALIEPEAAQGLTYFLRPDDVFEIAGERGGQVVVYASTEPISQFVAGARTAVMQRGAEGR
jgi:hypothetical protein